MTIEFVDIDAGGRRLTIEYQWLGRERRAAPLMVFLHEGLGSVAMWRDFPQRLVDALGWRGLVYSRPGYGRSTPRMPDETWAPDFMHHQAHAVMPALMQTLDIDTAHGRPWLFGHSDGGSIALLHTSAFPARVAGLVVLAPHLFVEDVSITNIERAREAYLSGVLKDSLAKYHADVDSAFWGWNDIWLHPSFRSWNITGELGSITCPLLAVQGLNDEYGTLAQIHGIAERVPGTRLLELQNCRHSPHRDQPELVIATVKHFVNSAS